MEDGVCRNTAARGGTIAVKGGSQLAGIRGSPRV